MGRKHGQFKRKRTIDLNALGKKQRKLYREGDKTKSPVDDEEEKHEKEVYLPEKEEDISSDDEINPYQQFIATFSSKEKAVIDSDEQSENSEGSFEDDENQIKINKKKYKEDEVVDQNDLESTSAEEEFENEVTDDLDSSDGNNDDDEQNEDGESDSDIEDNLDSEIKHLNNESSEDELEVLTKDEDDHDDFSLTSSDPFIAHFERDIDEKDVTEISSNSPWKKEDIKIPGVGEAKYLWSCDSLKPKITHRKDKALIEQHVKESLCKTLAIMKKEDSDKDHPDGLTTLQAGMFSVINNYQDISYTERSAENGEDIRLVYCLHALNHVLKTRRRVIVNNTKIKKKGNSTEDIDYRDQGLTRPKVLMVVPFRESVCRVVNILIKLLGQTEKSLVENKTRFFDEYGLDPEEKPKNSRKPDDFQQTFAGNCDDHFRIGIGIAKKTLKLYTQFYKSDIIVASPLGLRTLIKTEKEKERDFDFLSSIEVLIMDQTDILMMQNWQHVLHLMDHMHLQPKDSHGVDFSRVRMWTLNGWSKYYRQSLVFSSYSIPEVNALFNKHCFNYAGKYSCVRRPAIGTICQVVVQVPQVFHRVDCSSYTDMPDDRFNFFVKKILPTHFDSLMAQTLIYVHSYFDYVRLRNHFTREEIKYTAVNEYTREKDVNTARNLFFQKIVPFMIYTERFHFFKRSYLTGIRHIIFYGLPQYPHFYSEICNMIQTDKNSKGDNLTCTVIYTKYEAQKLAEITGSTRAGKMIHSEKTVHMFVTGEN